MTPIRRLLGYFARYKRPLILGALCVLGSAAFSLLKPLIIGNAVNEVAHAVERARLVRYALLLLGAAALEGAFLYAQRWIIIGASRRIEFDMRNDFYQHLQKLPLSFYQEQRTGDLMSRATNDLAAVRMLIGPAVMHSLSSLLIVVGSFVMMLRIEPRMAFTALIAVPIVAGAVKFFGERIHLRFKAVQDYFGDISARVQENLAGMRVVRAFTQEANEIETFKRMNREYVERNRSLIRLTATFYPALHMVIGLMFVLIFFLGARKIVQHTLTIGDFVAFNFYLGRMIWPLIALGWVINLFQRGMASMQRLHEIWSQLPVASGQLPEERGGAAVFRQPATGNRQPVAGAEAADVASSSRPSVAQSESPVASDQWPEGLPVASDQLPEEWPVASGQWPEERGGAAVFRQPATGNQQPVTGNRQPVAGADVDVRGDIEIRDLTFAYPTSTRPVLRDLNLSIRAGQTIGIVGRTGSGKSTLLQLIMRTFEPPPGTIFIDGRPLEAISLHALREMIGAVPQETFLFSESIAENIRFGRADATDAEIEMAANEAGLATDVATFPSGIGTVIGERGITLSGGQKQRTAIARALIRNPPILILDDSLSAVDTQTEEKILNALRSIRKGRTVLIVSHRASSVKDADHIVVIENGRIVERGTHESLLAKRGYYADLYRRQTIEAEIEEIA